VAGVAAAEMMLLEMGRSRKMWKQRWWCSLVKTSGGAEGFGEGLEVAAKHRGRERGGDGVGEDSLGAWRHAGKSRRRRKRLGEARASRFDGFFFESSPRS
jgi:hypothetical protein